MILLDELRLELVGYRREMQELADVLSIKAAKERIELLNEETAKEGFWDDLENSQKVLQETKALERKIEKYNKLNNQLEDVITLIELSIEENDESSVEEIKSEAESFKISLRTKSFQRFSQANMTELTLFLRFTPEQAVPRHRIGQRCFIACTTCGLSVIIIKSPSWIILTAMMQA